VTVETDIGARIKFSAGMGAVFNPNEPYTLKSDTGAIILIVESQELTAHTRAISTPQRIEGATWPSDSLLSARCLEANSQPKTVLFVQEIFRRP
jgi:hypothetical protein